MGYWLCETEKTFKEAIAARCWKIRCIDFLKYYTPERMDDIILLSKPSNGINI
jgi:hypothetical protein